jgi:hypothetical protein
VPDLSTTDRTTAHGPRSGRNEFVPRLVDVLVPVGIYFALRRAEVGNVLALTAGAFVPALRVITSIVRDRRVAGLAAFVLAIFALSIALAFVTGNARVLLAKESVFTMLAGVYCLGSLFVGRPFSYYTMRRFVVGDEEEAKAEWENSEEFRHTMVIVSPILLAALVVVLVIFSRVYGKRVGREFGGEASARA